jgi:pimeloyl-ACP methyl ester carboxylesterase
LIEPIIERVALAEIPGSPGTVTAPPLFLPGPRNDRLWHLGFNRIDELNEQLVAGREDVFYRWEFDAAAKKLPDDVINYYVRALSNPDSLRGNFGWYRALNTTIAQDQQRKTRWLTMPVLAIGGEKSFGEHVADAVKAVADDVESLVIPATGHFVAEEAPDEMLAALTEFLAPYREASVAQHEPRPHAAHAPGP